MEKTVSTITIARSEYENLNTELKELKVLVEYYKHQLLLSKRRQFGASSEKLDETSDQLNLFGSESIAPPPTSETKENSYTRKKRKDKREEDLSGLPVERIDYELGETERACPECGEVMRDIGVQTRRELKLIPAKVVVLEHATHTYACRSCEQNGTEVPIVKAKGPSPLISGSLASPSLVAHISVQKYLNGLPLYRLESGFRCDDIYISRQTMANWVIACSERYLEGGVRAAESASAEGIEPSCGRNGGAGTPRAGTCGTDEIL